MSIESAFLFREVSEKSIAAVRQIAVSESYAKGSFLFQAGDPAEYLYILEDGRVRLSVARGGHLAHLLSGPGEAFGWSSMVGNEVYTASAECVGPAKALKLERNALRRILDDDPASGLVFFRRLAELIGRRLAESYGAVLSVSAPPDSRSWG